MESSGQEAIHSVTKYIYNLFEQLYTYEVRYIKTNRQSYSIMRTIRIDCMRTPSMLLTATV